MNFLNLLYKRKPGTNRFVLNWQLLLGLILVLSVIVWTFACKFDVQTTVTPPEISICNDGGFLDDAGIEYE